jgi:predicted TIM-barrel fold metal-dependent hydrolase
MQKEEMSVDLKSKQKTILFFSVALVVILMGTLWFFRAIPEKSLSSAMKTSFFQADPTPASTIEPSMAAPSAKPISDLVEKYRELKLIDTHNHDASRENYHNMMDIWKRDAVDQIVLFGNVSERSAIDTDLIAWKAYQQYPQTFIPYFSGFDLHDKASLDVIKHNLEEGYFGLGEIAAASTYSPMVSKVEWKAKDPMDGFLPQIYDLCAQYKVPILLHIDPPNGIVIDKLEEALDSHPNTIIIFGHANAFNSPENIQKLLEKHPNLYADFFAGFTALNPESTNKLDDFVPVMKKFQDRFMLSTDSGYGLESEEAADGAMYRLIDLLDDQAIAKKIAHDNIYNIINNEPATVTQLKAIEDKTKQTGQAYDVSHLSKVQAGQILWGK